MIVQVSSAYHQRSSKASQILGSNPSYPWDYPQFPPAAHDDPDIVHVFGISTHFRGWRPHRTGYTWDPTYNGGRTIHPFLRFLTFSR
ncbi:hypothetical protein HanRHA438_Chr17g0825791 [Helianthus annuus]|nr:hypothetical protein HanPI659440_Chr16g0630901 [Helianthus annuus]KAJ0827442.1 hypothetical protein HanRHA438_Chr17g0825791 [Helianthus annuus]